MAVKKEKNFEESLARLEEILHALESGDASLDEMLKLYEEGIGLIRFCNEKLEHAEQSVKILQLQPDGKVAMKEFDQGEDD